LELKRRWYEVYCIQDKNCEIDFFTEKWNKKAYFQVSYSLKNKHTYDREINCLLKQKDNYEKFILTLDEWEKEDRWIIIKNIIDWAQDSETFKL
jgi:predicted AAA+ superfamily ATPase